MEENHNRADFLCCVELCHVCVCVCMCAGVDELTWSTHDTESSARFENNVFNSCCCIDWAENVIAHWSILYDLLQRTRWAS